MQPQIKFNDAWESIPLECADEMIDYLDDVLQATHPLRSYNLFPIAKCWRQPKYLIEEEDATDNLWVLDLQRKMRIRGKTCYYFKRLETQKELDTLLQADHKAWVQYMKDAGAWEE